MPASALAPPHSWVLRVVFALGIPTIAASACSPPQAADRTSSGVAIGVGGAMRNGSSPGKAATTPAAGTSNPSDPPKTTASVDPMTGDPGPTSDAGTSPPTTPAVTPTSPSDAGVPPAASVDAGAPATSPTPSDPPANPPAPTPDAGPAGYVPDPALSTSTAADCKNSAAWVAGSGPYLGGEKVTHGTPKRKFECRPWPYAPWCAQVDYEPGRAGSFWVDAWIDRGICP